MREREREREHLNASIAQLGRMDVPLLFLQG